MADSTTEETVIITDDSRSIQFALVLKYLPSRDLLKARLVCKQWDWLCISILCERNEQALIIEGVDASEVIPIEIKCVKETDLGKYKKVPCSQFKLNKVKLRSPQVKEFLDSQGKLMKQLEIILRYDTKLSSLINLLQNQAPNLEYVKLMDIPDWGHLKRTNISEKLVSLPKLKTLALEPIVPKFWDRIPEWLLEAILKAANNLEEVVYFPLNGIYLLENTDKVHTLKELYYYVKKTDYREARALGYGDDFDVHYYTDLSRMRPKLKMLDNAFTYKLIEHPDAWAEAEIALTSILISSQDTLQEFYTQAFGFLERVNLPRMANLRKLVICVRADDPGRRGSNGIRTVFPPGVNILHTFPNVDDCSITASSDQPFSTCFPSAMFKPHSFPMVKKLHIDFSLQSLSKEEWVKLVPVFPSVSYVSIVSFLGKLSTDLERLWTSWAEVEYLEIQINDDSKEFKLPAYPFLDEILTGIPEGKCHKFRKLSTSGREDYRKFKVRPCVADLKKLKVLALVFPSMTAVELHLKKRPILSKFTYNFCQLLHPSLKLMTLCRQKN